MHLQTTPVWHSVEDFECYGSQDEHAMSKAGSYNQEQTPSLTIHVPRTHSLLTLTGEWWFQKLCDEKNFGDSPAICNSPNYEES